LERERKGGRNKDGIDRLHIDAHAVGDGGGECINPNNRGGKEGEKKGLSNRPPGERHRLCLITQVLSARLAYGPRPGNRLEKRRGWEEKRPGEKGEADLKRKSGNSTRQDTSMRPQEK